ncbi:retrovirus-related Pol polyprotein from transposon 412 [Trichonephila clavipes]|nr:retrovirus-related Pol polyprotein from transposon 412 [Trichonephila clavipes]
MVLPAGQGKVPHPSIVPECFTINQLWNDRCTWPWGHCLLSELREWSLQTGRHNRLNTVRSAGCKCLPFLLVKSAREVPAFRFFPEKDKEEVSSVFTCNVKCIMAFLLRERKDVLLEVAKELRVEIDITLPKIEFKKRICQSEDYNEESVKKFVGGYLGGKQEARELKERQEARELKERQETREYELERLRLSNATETVSVSSADLEGQGIVAKEPLEKSDDYPHIKNLLLARFQLTPIALRNRFESHQRRPGAMWVDLVFELRSYLDNWLAGMKVGDFAALKELLVTEQIKKRAPSELVDHFLDSWDGFKEAKSLAEKLDHFEAIRRVHKKQVRRKPGSVEPLINSLSKVKINLRILVDRFPREIQSDLGTSFSELATTFFNKFGIKVTRSSVSHPQSNAVERVHRTIKRVIKALCVESGEDWEGVLPLALFSLRTVAHESTGFSPTELVMGKNLRTPQTLVYEEWMEEGKHESIGSGIYIAVK